MKLKTKGFNQPVTIKIEIVMKTSQAYKYK